MTADTSDHDGSVPASATEPSWQRLHSRMIWVDACQALLSLTPTALAVGVFGVSASWGSLWPVVVVAVFGVIGAVTDALRWVFTRYRVTSGYVERRTGVFVRRYRSVRRDRIRSVDATAKLRHRLAGLRVITIGAGQQTNAGESAFVLDAILKADAEQLRHQLLWGSSRTASVDAGADTGDDDEPGVVPATEETAHEPGADGEIFARLRPRWVVYNVMGVWAFFMAGGLLWGGFWIASALGLDVAGFLAGIADWEALGWGWTIAIAVTVTGAIGAVGLAANFFTDNWNFELARVPGENGTLLRTRKGLFTTREVNRDDNRLRGVHIAEPLLWRWMGMADTTVITTGLSMWSSSQPAAILPRGPVDVATKVAADVLRSGPNAVSDPGFSPIRTPLARHPSAALRRRLWWAALTSASVTGVLVWLVAADVVPAATVWIGLALCPLSVLAAVIAYRALGHAIAGPYLVARSGLTSRSTVALKRTSVSTIALRESVLQRRLGLKTVSAMTAAGWGIYEAPDVKADEAVVFAAQAAPGLLDPFLEYPDQQVGGADELSGPVDQPHRSVQ